MNYSLDYFLEKLRSREPFAVSRFNDGEMGVILGTHGIVSRGDQKSSTHLKIKLLEAMTYRHHNYFVGMPDKKYGDAYKNAEMIVGDYENLTSSVVFHDKNWIKAMDGLVENASNYDNILWVGSNKHDVSKLPFKVSKHIKTKNKDSFDDYNKLRDLYIHPNSLVFVSCGPLGRVLTKEWFERDHSLTILEVGSVFDPVIQNIWRPYQKRQRDKALSVIERW